jgi:hypothetical protein
MHGSFTSLDVVAAALQTDTLSMLDASGFRILPDRDQPQTVIPLWKVNAGIPRRHELNRAAPLAVRFFLCAFSNFRRSLQ